MTGVPPFLLRLLKKWLAPDRLDLGGLALLTLLLLHWLEGHRGVDLGYLLLEELVHLVVGPSDHRRSCGAAPPVAGGGLLRDGGLHEGGPVGGGQVGQLQRQLGVLDDGIREYLLVPVPDVVAPFDHVCILGDVATAAEVTAGADVLQVEQLVVLVALVTESPESELITYYF